MAQDSQSEHYVPRPEVQAPAWPSRAGQLHTKMALAPLRKGALPSGVSRCKDREKAGWTLLAEKTVAASVTGTIFAATWNEPV